jgi:hypothetical protein
MATQGLVRKLRRLEALAQRRQQLAHRMLDRLRDEPALFMGANGMKPDPWQERLLRSTAARLLLLCSRQAGNPTGTPGEPARLVRPRQLCFRLAL